MDRVFSWVDNGGTGLFTAYDLSPEQQSNGGFRKFGGIFGGFIAAEFQTNKELGSVIRDLDLSMVKFAKPAGNEGALLTKHNGDTRQGPDPEDLDYLVADFDSRFEARLEKGEVVFRGTLYIYSRTSSEDQQRAYVSAVSVLPDGNLKDIPFRRRGIRQGARGRTRERGGKVCNSEAVATNAPRDPTRANCRAAPGYALRSRLG